MPAQTPESMREDFDRVSFLVISYIGFARVFRDVVQALQKLGGRSTAKSGGICSRRIRTGDGVQAWHWWG